MLKIRYLEKIACLRYFNPIGAHKSSLIGENPIGEPNNLFPLICNTAFDENKKTKDLWFRLGYN